MMRSGPNCTVIFEGKTEARIAAQYLKTAAHPELVEGITPPIEPARIGPLGFLATLVQEQRGVRDETLYTSSPGSCEIIASILFKSAGTFFESEPVFRRQHFLNKMMAGYIDDLEDGLETAMGVIDTDREHIAQLVNNLIGIDSDTSLIDEYLEVVDKSLEILEPSRWMNPAEVA